MKHSHRIRTAVLSVLLAAAMVPSAVYAARTFGISPDGKTNTVMYDTNNTEIQGTYEEPAKADGSKFLGWSTSKTATTAQYTKSTLNNYLRNVQKGQESTLYAVWKAPSQLKYAVSVYGINVDGAGTVTFGPAPGNYVTSHKAAHIAKDSETSTDMCVHNHTWTEVIAQIKKDPTVFQNCITNHCTISVPLKLNDTLKGQHADDYADAEANGDGAGQLIFELKDEWKIWNPQASYAGASADEQNYGTNKGGWPKSRIRAVLNGSEVLDGDYTYADGAMKGYTRTPGNESNDSWSNWSWNQNIADSISTITSSNCLLSCFPKELQESIVPKDVKSDTVYNDTSGNSVTTQDKLWLFSMQEFGHTGYRSNEGTTYPARTSISGTQFYYIYGGKSSSVSSYDLWLRSLRRSDARLVYRSYGHGWHSGYAGYGGHGAAPGFVVG